jgi:hypothetical protein
MARNRGEIQGEEGRGGIDAGDRRIGMLSREANRRVAPVNGTIGSSQLCYPLAVPVVGSDGPEVVLARIEGREVPYTINLIVDRTVEGVYADLETFVARIRFGAGGLSSQVDVDFGVGGRVVIHAGYIQVSGMNNSFGVDPARLGAYITPGATPYAEAPSYTRPQVAAAIAAGVWEDIARPKYAQSVVVSHGALLSNLVGISMLDSMASVIDDTTLTSGSRCGSIPIPNDCRTIRITNRNAAVPLVGFRAMFGLNL